VWTELAIRDRRQIHSHIAADNAAAADEFDALLAAKIQALAIQPLMGRAGREPGTRELVLHRNYVAVYVPEATQVVVVRILHSAQRWPV